jgi:DMSO/TMAO reductase YedYZ molybdopterin-dependent catalytic subunit
MGGSGRPPDEPSSPVPDLPGARQRRTDVGGGFRLGPLANCRPRSVGVAVVVMAPWKATVSQRGIRRRGVLAAAPALALAFLVAVSLLTGLVHRFGARDAGPVIVMQLHVGAALVALPLALWHVVPRPVRPRRTDLSRRTLLRGALLACGSTFATLGLPHAGRAVTRSLEQGSFQPAAMPVTQWLTDKVPIIDGDAWRLQVAGRAWSLDELRDVAGEELIATLDCTGGWYAHQSWSGVRLDHLLSASGAPAGRSIEVVSVTGYRRRFPARDAPVFLLATRVNGRPLSSGHGFPARLVAPNRRGFWWVKWVNEITVDQRPWWWQSPFPRS